jgi:hypothetical protein
LSKAVKIYRKNLSRYRRLVYSNRRKSPHISGDTFAQLCDLRIDHEGFRDIKLIKSARSIFCQSHTLEEFIGDYHKVINAKILFAGNSDFEFHDLNLKLPRSVKRIYLQNSFVSDSKRVFTLPIGLENLSLGGSNSLGRFLPIPYSLPNSRVLLGPFGETHQVRKQIDDMFKNYSKQIDFKYVTGHISKRSYRKLLQSFNFVACPRGNGVDTHRAWESLYYGRYPIVIRDEWALSLAYLKLPLVFLSNWTPKEVIEINSNSPSSFDPSKIESLWEPYWIKILKTI